MKQQPEPSVVQWLDAQPGDAIWTTSVTVFEVKYGLRAMAAGRRQVALQNAFDEAMHLELAGRILSFDEAAATEAAVLSASLRRMGQTVDIRDVQIAGIVAAQKACLATRNIRHFVDTGIEIVDPWNDAE